MNTNFCRREAAKRGEKTARCWRTPGKALALAPNRMVSGLAVLLLLAAAGQTACENWELKAYRGIAAANIAYERSFATIVALHAQGRVSDQSYAQAKAVATRIHTFLEKGTGLMVTYQAIKSDATRAEVQAILNQLPILLAQISALVSAATAPPAGDFDTRLGELLAPLTTRLDRLDAISLEAAQ